ncbi:hypothetical protein [Isoptericola variabilis]|uniref:Uncharacterized protein n=1 Tax=Isoptericola variabilis (strain 225) TaxID=743718 RepID=F6FSS5_ISOV2|nr:hypothetical protein [Isoptericola variabilis]AEG45237.1 hypothetical protein Isova_2530 [Isoptericola variabilis 225]
MESAAGLAALALFVLWLGYWVPQRLRHRQQLLESRVEDRFSGGLRVLAVAGGGPSAAIAPPAEPPQARPLLMASSPTVDAGGGERGMAQVPTGRALERRPATGATPAVRASRLALLERRAARARRRLVLTLLLVVLTAVGWTAVGLGYVHWWGGAAPTAMLALVLVLGRAAVVAARRADERWVAAQRAARREAVQARALANGGPYAPRNRARVTGRAVHPSATHTQMIPRVDAAARPASREPAAARARAVAAEDRAEPTTEPEPVLEPAEERAPTIIEQPAPGTRPGGVGGEAWDPVPVPLPTYVTKPEAPRREPKPLTGATPVASSATVAAAVAAAAATATASATGTGGATSEPPSGGEASADAAAASADELLADEAPRQRTETLGLPLEQILARRRAAG